MGRRHGRDRSSQGAEGLDHGRSETPTPAEKLYRRVELERQTLRKETVPGRIGRWFDMKANLDILDNLPANERARVTALPCSTPWSILSPS